MKLIESEFLYFLPYFIWKTTYKTRCSICFSTFKYTIIRSKQHSLYHMFRFICGNKSFSLFAKKLGTNACVLSLESVSHFLTSCNVPTPVPTINVFKPQFLPKRMSVSALKKDSFTMMRYSRLDYDNV